MKAFAKDKDKLKMQVMARQLLKFMDTSRNGSISLDEFQAFDWAHVLDRIKDALALERREMAGKLAGTRYELTGNTDYTSINDSVTAFAHREEEWSGIIEIAEDGKILMPDLSLRYKPKGSSNRGDGFIDTEKSMNRQGWGDDSGGKADWTEKPDHPVQGRDCVLRRIRARLHCRGHV